ncbi:hypothetical protein [Actinoallomurus bryophytorum]|nr:hypothetical protein [Actinoallomurus bryophytorum]
MLISCFPPSEVLRYGVLATVSLPYFGGYASAPSAQSLNSSALEAVDPSV